MTVLQNFKNLFSRRKSGHLTEYVYEYDDSYYEQLLNYDDYYNACMEDRILSSNSKRIRNVFPEIHQVIDIGVGTESSVESKTCKFLGLLKEFQIYSAIDLHEEFAKLVGRQVLKLFPKIESRYYQANFLSKLSDINELLERGERNNVITFFGSTLGNLSNPDIDLLMANFQSLTSEGDYLVMGIDCNQDPSTLNAAYNNYWLKQLTLNTMRYLKEIACLDDFDPEAFDFVYNWNTNNRTVELGLKAQSEQQISIEGEIFTIRVGDYFHIINSKKFLIKEIEELMQVNNFQIIDSLKASDELPNYRLLIGRKL
ncbi:L-histidine N(alpha)-methyltransferase [Candidatus Bandiella euplotis]|uniref:SAM-dependent methyltransferase n=1 Tax=Candidatus Bandiella euplotis TaxID=1664265 RepID=A0ABZ0ULA4_9RICK|nr:L-histidine N(alpha)-methyltransferase [Candidatus Bandiella woodruffii]WPX96732.1 SAM-dependent methyltransferase [Candidatus Bandiella woodruffii]